MRYAVVNTTSNIVENIVQWDGNSETWQPPDGSIAVEAPDDVEVGASYDPESGEFTPAPPPTPDPDDVVRDNITNAPTNLTGGPTLAEVFNVHN
jgi:hypothetical protein